MQLVITRRFHGVVIYLGCGRYWWAIGCGGCWWALGCGGYRCLWQRYLRLGGGAIRVVRVGIDGFGPSSVQGCLEVRFVEGTASVLVLDSIELLLGQDRKLAPADHGRAERPLLVVRRGDQVDLTEITDDGMCDVLSIFADSVRSGAGLCLVPSIEGTASGIGDARRGVVGSNGVAHC